MSVRASLFDLKYLLSDNSILKYIVTFKYANNYYSLKVSNNQYTLNGLDVTLEDLFVYSKLICKNNTLKDCKGKMYTVVLNRNKVYKLVPVTTVITEYNSPIDEVLSVIKDIISDKIKISTHLVKILCKKLFDILQDKERPSEVSQDILELYSMIPPKALENSTLEDKLHMMLALAHINSMS